jgi:hypothetical protein
MPSNTKCKTNNLFEKSRNISHIKDLFKHYALHVDATVSDEHLLEEVAVTRVIKPLTSSNSLNIKSSQRPPEELPESSSLVLQVSF